MLPISPTKAETLSSKKKKKIQKLGLKRKISNALRPFFIFIKFIFNVIFLKSQSVTLDTRALGFIEGH